MKPILNLQKHIWCVLPLIQDRSRESWQDLVGHLEWHHLSNKFVWNRWLPGRLKKKFKADTVATDRLPLFIIDGHILVRFIWMIGTWIRIGCSLNPEGYQPFKSVWYATQHVLLSHKLVGNKPCISEGFYICDRPWDLKWGPNRFFSPCHLEIWQMTSGNNREAIPCSENLCVSYLSHSLIRIGVVIRKRSNRSQIINCTTRPRGLEIWPINNGALHLRRFDPLCVIL